jgi:hypothetical protein
MKKNPKRGWRCLVFRLKQSVYYFHTAIKSVMPHTQGLIRDEKDTYARYA